MRKSLIKRKKLGQHFLVDRSIADRIIDASCVTRNDRVLEIGPGKGVLTRRLLKRGERVWAVELDKELYYDLASEFSTEEYLTIEQCNALHYDYGSIPAPYHVVSNLPYSVSVALVKRFVANHDKIASATVMVQAEVAQRMYAKPGGSHYGSLSVFIAYNMNVERLFSVPPEAFRPMPKVESEVIRLTPNTDARVEVSNELEFFSLVQTAFAHRRKTIKNNLGPLWPNAEVFKKTLELAEVDPMMRAQEISLQKYAIIFENWDKLSRELDSNMASSD